MIKKDRRHGTKGRRIGPAVRYSALKAGAHTADLYSARSYARRLMACLDSLGLVLGEQLASAGPDQVATATADTPATAAADTQATTPAAASPTV